MIDNIIIPSLNLQLMSCQVVVPAKSIMATAWAGLSLFRVLRKKELQSTDRLIQEKCQGITGQWTKTAFCTSEKSPSFFILTRSGDEWLVERNRIGKTAALKATVQENLLIPPTTGWKFHNSDRYTDEEDPQLQCSITPSSSSCSVTVSLSGQAKAFQGECDGEYKETGLRSAGRKVIFFSILSSAHLEIKY